MKTLSILMAIILVAIVALTTFAPGPREFGLYYRNDLVLVYEKLAECRAARKVFEHHCDVLP